MFKQLRERRKRAQNIEWDKVAEGFGEIDSGQVM